MDSVMAKSTLKRVLPLTREWIEMKLIRPKSRGKKRSPSYEGVD